MTMNLTDLKVESDNQNNVHSYSVTRNKASSKDLFFTNKVNSLLFKTKSFPFKEQFKYFMKWYLLPFGFL
jgi:hypothetical protein